MNIAKLFVLTCAALGAAHCAVQDSNRTFAPLQVPAKTLPVPADVSPELQKIIICTAEAGLGCLVENRRRVAGGCQCAGV